MTEFGVDGHPTFQAGLNVAALPGQGISFLLIKITEGTGWYRAAYHDFAAAAKAAGLLFSAYHFLRSESTGEAQAAWTQRCMGDDWGVVPVMLDWETSVAGTRAGVATANAYIAETRRRGGRIHLNYLPRWYWQLLGSPNLAAAGPVSTLALIQSSYGTNPAGAPPAIYPGDQSGRWVGFGGLPVSILQFGSNARVPSYGGPLDINAYRGTRAALAAAGWFHDPNPQEDDMDPSTPIPVPSGFPAPDYIAPDSDLADLLHGSYWHTLNTEKAVTRLAADQAARDAADAVRDAGVLAAVTHLADVITAGGGSVDTAAILQAIKDGQADVKASVAAKAEETLDRIARAYAAAAGG